MQMRNLIAAGVILGAANVAGAAVTVTDIRSTSDGGGVWLNSNASATGNWAIWAADASNPATFTPSSFLNDNGSRPFDAMNNPTGDRHDPLKVFSLADGTHTYLLYKGDYGASDTGSTFYLSNGVPNAARWWSPRRGRTSRLPGQRLRRERGRSRWAIEPSM